MTKYSEWVYEGKPIHCKECGFEPNYSLNHTNSRFCPSCGLRMSKELTGKEVKERVIDYLQGLHTSIIARKATCPSWDKEFMSRCRSEDILVSDILSFVKTLEVTDE